MQELPILTDVGRKILHCCVYDLDDMRRSDCELRPHMIRSYFDEKSSDQISLVEINECILYFEEVGLIRELHFDMHGQIHSFRLSHKGFYYFELEDALKREYRRKLLCNSLLLPILASILTTVLTILLTA